MQRLAALFVLVLAASGCGGGSSEVVPDVGDETARAQLAVAEANLNAWYRANGTYAGAQIGVPGMRLVRADATSWCVETETAHATGPGGTLEPGRC